MNVEASLTQNIGAIGGVHVRSIVGDSPAFENADFLFGADSVVAELKSLDEDKILDEGVIQGASELYLQELPNDPTLPIIFGEVLTTTAGRSEAFARKIAALYEKPIKRMVEKANRQIKDTVAALNVPMARGLLIIANNRHSAIDPAHAHYLLQRVLRRQTYGSINAVVYMSAGQKVTLPGAQHPVDVFFELRRDRLPPVQPDFITKFREVWYRCLSQERGIDEYHEVQIDEGTLIQLENRTET
ncbi:MAG: hypothetical protein JWR16_220 [Nevskia sp.]|nr:hypothetical protein [Nevskia sp.]